MKSESTNQSTRVSVRTPVAAVLGATAAATAIWAVATMAGAELTVSYAPGQPMKITVVNVSGGGGPSYPSAVWVECGATG